MIRRTFLQAVIGAIAAGTLASQPALAVAPTNDPFLRDVAETVRRYQEIVQFSKDHALISKSWTAVTHELVLEVNQKISSLLTQMMGAYDESQATVEQCRFVFNYQAEVSEETLTAIAKGAIPVFVMRSLISRDKVPLVISYCLLEWHQFAARYNRLLSAI